MCVHPKQEKVKLKLECTLDLVIYYCAVRTSWRTELVTF